MSALMKKDSSDMPLWLSIACEELRVYGDFWTINDKIQKFPEDLTELMKDVLRRLIQEDETKSIEKILCLIHCSHAGLPEKFIPSFLGDVELNEAAPAVVWATARRHLKPFLRLSAKKISMVHKSYNQVNILSTCRRLYL